METKEAEEAEEAKEAKDTGEAKDTKDTEEAKDTKDEGQSRGKSLTRIGPGLETAKRPRRSSHRRPSTSFQSYASYESYASSAPFASWVFLPRAPVPLSPCAAAPLA
jgi:hypothetical protein